MVIISIPVKNPYEKAVPGFVYTNAEYPLSQFTRNVIKVQSCSDQLIAHQVDSLKNLYSDDGFVLLKEASITMESEFEMPVIVPLNTGKSVSICFYW